MSSPHELGSVARAHRHRPKLLEEAPLLHTPQHLTRIPLSLLCALRVRSRHATCTFRWISSFLRSSSPLKVLLVAGLGSAGALQEPHLAQPAPPTAHSRVSICTFVLVKQGASVFVLLY
jgi:hypothetical protein